MKLTSYAIRFPLWMSLSIILSNASFASNAESLIVKWAKHYRVDPEFALMVAKHESGISCGVIGSHGERGPLQILPSTARQLGFGNIRRASCDIQTQAGMDHLQKCLNGSSGNRWRAAACHNQGMSALGGRITARAKRYADAVFGICSKGTSGHKLRNKPKVRHYTNNFGAGL